MNDFFTLQDGKFGKGIMNNSSIKCIFQMEQNDINVMKDIVCLSEEECYRIKNMIRGTCLIHTDKVNLIAKIEASKKEHEIITTDRKDLEKGTIYNWGDIYEEDTDGIR